MRILFWTDGFWPRLGGIETMGFQFIREMRERGHQFIVLAQRDKEEWKEEETYRGISIKRIDFNAIVEKRNLKVIRSVQEYLEQILKEFQPDIIHLNAALGGSAFAFLLFRKMFLSPVVFTCHAPYLLEGRFLPLVEKIASSVDQICCVSYWVLEEMKKYLPLQMGKLRCIYNGLPMPQAIPSPPSFSPPVLLAFGRLAPEKGFDTAIQAFALLKKKNSAAQLIVAGGGPERVNLEKLAHALALGDAVQFTGVLSDEEALAAFHRAAIVLVPSILESFGLVILEAMQNQRPVVASRVEGVPEVVADGETGLLVPMRDPAAFCKAIETLLEQPERAIQMGIRGRERAAQFTIHQNAVQYESLYRELIR